MLATRLARVGRAEAAFNLATMRRAGLRAPLVWVDIESRTKAPWSANIANNNAVIDGVLAGYKAGGGRTGVYSYDKAWKSITGTQARPAGSLLTALMNVLLAVGSRGSAVAVLQRRLGGVKADGVFGPLTKAKVVAFQRARHLSVNGVVTGAVWRALGAGVPYTPVKGSRMGVLFAST